MSNDLVFNSSLTSDLERDEELARAEIAVLAVIFVVTLTGNTAVLVALYARRFCTGNKKLPRMYFFILHLCVADLTTGLLNVFPQLCWKITYRFKGGPLLCKMVKYGQTMGPYLSSYILVATALDRYKAICEPLNYSNWTSRRSALTVSAAWSLTLLFCIPQVIIFSYQEIAPGVYDCWATFPFPWGERVYVTWYSVSVFLVPLCVLIYTYFCICWTLWRYSGLPDSSSPHHLISRAKINTVKQTVAVILLYVSCSSPFICAQLWASWGPRQPFFEGAAFTILTLLSSLNSCVNPWIYLSFNRELLRSLWRASVCTGSPRHHNLRGSASSCRRVTELTTTSAGDNIAATDNRHWCESLDDQSSSDKHSGLKTYRMQDSSSFQNRRLSKPAREVSLTPML